MHPLMLRSSFIRILTNVGNPARRRSVDSRGRTALTDLADEGDELPKTSPYGRWRAIALTAMQFVPPAVSIGCAITVGYLAHMVASQKPPADMAALAVSIMKSSDASPEMRDWAADALGIQS